MSTLRGTLKEANTNLFPRRLEECEEELTHARAEIASKEQCISGLECNLKEKSNKVVLAKEESSSKEQRISSLEFNPKEKESEVNLSK
jgi:hypothetical protein